MTSSQDLRSPSSTAALVLGLLLAPACSGVGGGDSETNAPFIQVLTPAGIQSDVVTFEYIVRDQDGRFVNVFPELIVGDASRPATPAPNSPPTAGVRASSFGEAYVFLWDSSKDLTPGFSTNVQLRFAVVGRDGVGDVVATTPISVDNTDAFRSVSGPVQPAPAQGVAAATNDNRAFVGLGIGPDDNEASTGFIFDSVSDTFLQTPSFQNTRVDGAAARVTSGVLVAAGRTNGALQAQAELLQITRANPLGTVVAAGALNTPRTRPQLTTLLDGSAIVSGGDDGAGAPVQDLELFQNNAFTIIASDAALARREHTATRLLDGRVLLSGGFDAAGAPLASAVLLTIDTVGQAATITAVGDLNAARARHSAILLADGRVLVAGGTPNADGAAGALSSLEIFNPTNNTFTTVAVSLATARRNPGLVPSNGDIVVIAGADAQGAPLASAERFDPSVNGLAATRLAPRGRALSRAIALGTGGALVVGGAVPAQIYLPRALISNEAFTDVNTVPVVDGALPIGVTAARSEAEAVSSTAEAFVIGGDDGRGGMAVDVIAFNLTTNVTSIRGQLITGRSRHRAVAFLQNGLATGALVIGGNDGNTALASCEIFDFVTGNSSQTGALNTARQDFTATVLADGCVLVAGGRDAAGNVLASAELYDIDTGAWVVTGALATARADAAAIRLPVTNEIFVAGGSDGANALASAEIYDPVAGTFQTVANTLSRGRILPALGFDGGGDFLAVIGGDDGSGGSADADLFQVSPRLFANTIALAFSRSNSKVANLGLGFLVLVGGTSGLTAAPPEVLDLTGDATLASGRRPADPNLLLERRAPAVVSFAGLGYIFGGRSREGVVLSGAEVFVR